MVSRVIGMFVGVLRTRATPEGLEQTPFFLGDFWSGLQQRIQFSHGEPLNDILSPVSPSSLPWFSMFAPCSHNSNYSNTQALALGPTLLWKSSLLMWPWRVILVECLLCHLYLHLPDTEASLWDLTVPSQSKETLPSSPPSASLLLPQPSHSSLNHSFPISQSLL